MRTGGGVCRRRRVRMKGKERMRTDCARRRRDRMKGKGGMRTGGSRRKSIE